MRTTALVLATTLAACSSGPKQASGRVSGAAVVPVGEASALVFSAAGVERVDGSQRAAFDAPAPRETPIAVANDASSGWSALAYPRAIVVVNASEARVKRVDGIDWEHAPEALGIGGTVVGTIEDGTIALYDALEGRRVWKEDGRKLLEQLGLEELRYVMPLSKERMLVVAFKRMGAFSEPQALIADIDRAGGVPTSQERPFGKDELHWLEACTGDGASLYVAGTTQREERTGPRDLVMTKTIVVIRHDPARGRNQVIVRAKQQPGTEVHVTALAAGWGLVAYALDDGRVNVYDATGERDAEHLWGEPRPGLTAIACVDAAHVALVSGSAVEMRRVRN